MREAMAQGRYLVTGGAGFIGSHLVEFLLAKGHRVVALDNLETGKLANLDAAIDHPNFRFVNGTVLDGLLVDDLANQSDVIVHLAASTGVRLIVEQPMRSFTQNLRGSEIVIDAAHRYGCKLLVASTSEVYGKNSQVPLNEEANRVIGPPIVPRWAYSIAKATEEILAYAYHRERGLDAVVVRLFNATGSRQNPDYSTVIPRMVRQAVAGQPLTVFGDGHQTRCFCHVDDVVEAMMRVLETPAASGKVFNVGGTEEVSMMQLAERIIELTAPLTSHAAGSGRNAEPSGDDKSTSAIVVVPYDQAYARDFEDMLRPVPDITRIRELTGWEPRFSLDSILAEAIADAVGETDGMGKVLDLRTAVPDRPAPKGLGRARSATPANLNGLEPLYAGSEPHETLRDFA